MPGLVVPVRGKRPYPEPACHAVDDGGRHEEAGRSPYEDLGFHRTRLRRIVNAQPMVTKMERKVKARSVRRKRGIRGQAGIPEPGCGAGFRG